MTQRPSQRADTTRATRTPAASRSASEEPDLVVADAAQHRVAARTRQEVEERYVAARDAWAAAMRRATSGTPADLAALSICQEEYEAWLAERERWIAGGDVASPIEPHDEERSVGTVVGQELAWRRVREHEPERPKGLLGLFRRRGRR